MTFFGDSMEQKIGISLSEEITVTRLISAFYYDFPKDFDYDGESHPGWEFVYVEKGRICVSADDMTYILKSGEMVCHKPFEFHALRPYQGEASVIIFCFHCDGSTMSYFNNKILSVSQRQKQYLNDIAVGARSLLLPKSPIDIVKDRAMDRAPAGTVAHEQYIKNTIELLILSLLSAHATERSKRIETYEQHLHRSSLASDITEYLNENLAIPVRLDEISRRFSYSLSSIKRIFKAETGYSIIDYLSNIRIAKAKELLRDSNITVEEISATLGYANIYYFSNVFKQKVGKSPTKYREEVRRTKHD